ncbi:Sensor kinase CckA [subsurface metagenome]
MKKNNKAPIPLKGKGKILVMDDDETVRDITVKMLKEIGYEVTLASEGAEALELYKAAGELGQTFAAVIMDLTIPGGMGGRETARRLYEIDPGVKAIVASGYAYDPVMVEFRKYNFCGAIVKPYQIDELNELLHEIIGE